MRTDGPFVEAGENDNLIVQRLQADPNAIGIFGYSFLLRKPRHPARRVQSTVSQPSAETIASGDYPISRPLFVYVKNAHRGVIPNLDEFIEEYVSEEAMGPGGYLSERGLVAAAGRLRVTKHGAAAIDAAPLHRGIIRRRHLIGCSGSTRPRQPPNFRRLSDDADRLPDPVRLLPSSGYLLNRRTAACDPGRWCASALADRHYHGLYSLLMVLVPVLRDPCDLAVAARRR